jgi:hypothetical protein
VIGATWLDQQLIGGGKRAGRQLGFGGEVHASAAAARRLPGRTGLAERRGQRVILARNLLGDAAWAGTGAAARTSLRKPAWSIGPWQTVQRVAGIYRRATSCSPAGAYAMLDDGMGFSLVPWKRSGWDRTKACAQLTVGASILVVEHGTEPASTSRQG